MLLPVVVRRILCLLSLGMGMLSASAGTIELRDDRGTLHVLAASPQRIVSLLPSLTESVCALGGCDRLVGVDRFSNWPASVQSLPRLGGLEDAQVERIAALKPQAVLVAPSARVIDRLDALGLLVIVVDAKTHADVERSLGLIGTLLNAPAQAQRAWVAIQQAMDAAAARVPLGLRGQRVYFEVDPAPYAASEVSFVGQTLKRLHMSNVVGSSLGPFPRLNPEFVVTSRPDVVMAAQRTLEEMQRRPGWAGMAALRQRRTCGFSPAQFDVLVRPGPRMGEGALLLADCLANIEGRT